MLVWKEEGRKAALLLDIGKRSAPRAAAEERLVRNMVLRGGIYVEQSGGRC